MTERIDDTERKPHYGAGRQPWDDIVDAGFAPGFSAGNVLKYLRRTKEPEHSIESARWYWERLKEMTLSGNANGELEKLIMLLSNEELAALQ